MTASDRSLQERLLVLILRLGSALLLTAFLTIVMPTSWMASSHRWLRMGEFPGTPLVDYLTRSVSALYGFHGIFLAVLSSDVRRFRPLVVFLAWMNVAFGLILLGVDLHAGLPWWWTAAEGPSVFVMGLMLHYLVRFVPRGGG